LNLASAVFGAAAVGLVLGLVRDHTGSPTAGAIAALALAVSHTFWFHAVTPEVYTLLAVLLLAALWLHGRYLATRHWGWLFAAGTALGLAMSNHLLAFLALPAGGLWLATARRPGARLGPAVKALAVWGAGVALGFAPYLIQLARMLRTFSPGEVMGPAIGTTFLAGLLAMTPLDLVRSLATYIVFLTLQFNPLGVGLGVYGLWRAWRSSAATWRLAAAAFAVYAAFGILYRVADQFAFFMTSYVFFALALGRGAVDWLHTRAPDRRGWAAAALAAGAVLMPFVYGAAPRLARGLGATDETLGIPAIGVGVRDGLAYYLNPNKAGDWGAYRFGSETLEALPPEAVVLAEWYTDTDEYFVLRYFVTVEGRRPDVRVEGWPTADPFAFESATAEALVQAEGARRPVYLASLSERYYGVSRLRADYCLVVEHNLYRAYPRGAQVDGAECL
jgi:hypothetical protein